MNWKISHSLKWDKYEAKERELRNSALNVAPATAWWDSARNTTEQLVNYLFFPQTPQRAQETVRSFFLKKAICAEIRDSPALRAWLGPVQR